MTVLVGGKERVATTISWSDTAKELIKRSATCFYTACLLAITLSDSCNLYICLYTHRLAPQSPSNSSSYILLETWRGCSRRIPPNERVLKVLDDWGFGTSLGEPVLQLIKKSSNALYKPRR